MLEVKTIDPGLRQEMVGTAYDSMAQLLRWIHYSMGNDIVPINSLRKRVVALLNQDYQPIIFSSNGRGPLKKVLSAIVEEAAEELGFKRMKYLGVLPWSDDARQRSCVCWARGEGYHQLPLDEMLLTDYI